MENYFNNVKETVIAAVDSVFAQQELISKAAQIIISTLESGGKVLWCGNGGSAAEAQHMSAELMVRFLRHRGPLASIALSTDTSLLTAHSNDFEYETVFSRQIVALGKPRDVLVAISTSGKSPNIVTAIKQAKDIGLKVIGLFGSKVNEYTASCDVSIHIDSLITARVQEGHTMVDHIICDLIDMHFSSNESGVVK
jgi:D-sedoheptulose 7-phosphate isomerase